MASRMKRSQGERPPEQSAIMARLAAAASGAGQELAVDRPYEYLKTGLVIRRDLDDTAWRDILPEIKALRNSYQLIIGDWMVYGFEHGYEVDYQAMAALTGLQPQTVEVFTSVCRNVPQLTRVNSLSFKHYRLIAPLPQDEQPHWIDFAVSHGMSSRSLADWIKRAKTDPQLTDPASHDDELAQLQAGMPDGVTVERMEFDDDAPALSDDVDDVTDAAHEKRIVGFRKKAAANRYADIDLLEILEAEKWLATLRRKVKAAKVEADKQARTKGR